MSREQWRRKGDKYMVWRLRRLLNWHQYAGSIARAARDVLGRRTVVYVVGGAAENRLTALSDIDVLIVSENAPRSLRDRLRLAVLIRDRAVTAYGLPVDYPIDLHIYRPEEFGDAGKHYKAMIRIS